MIARGTRGQSSVELVALLPLFLVLGLALAQVLAAGITRELAGHAAQAGAMAIVQDTGDPERAARAAIPGWSRRRTTVVVAGSSVVVQVRPPRLLPGLSTALTTTRRAYAGRAQ